MDFSDEVVEALLLTGWDISVDVSGRIMAQLNGYAAFGMKNSTDGTVGWNEPVGAVITEARIASFKRLIEEHKAAE
jgi:hypothetical protein